MNSLYRFVCAICLLFAVVCTPIQATAELVDSTLPHSITSVDFLTEDSGVLPAKFVGAATYAISIDRPDGRQGVDPDLTLKYNSIYRDSWTGFGWQLEFGAIERNSKFGVNYGADDFVYRTSDGAYELVKTSGNEFRLKIEGRFLRFIKGTAPDGRPMWTMTNKLGVKYLFGLNVDTRMDNAEDDGQIYRWCLERIEDLDGNYLTATYFKDIQNNQIYLEQIDYTGHEQQASVHSIQFILENRNDLPARYKPKFREHMLYRLKAIDIKSLGNLIKRYDLAYEESSSSARSLLESIRIIGSDGASVLRTIEFDYSQSEVAFVDRGGWATTHSWDNNSDDFIPADINGDGRTDIVHGPKASGSWYVYTANGSQFVERKSGSNYGEYSTSPERTFAADVTGDGSQEIIVGPHLNYPQIFDPGLCGDGGHCVDDGMRTDYTAAPTSGGEFYVLDFENGQLVDKGAWNNTTAVWRNYEKSVHVADVNGDGRKDLVVGPDPYGFWRLLLSDGTSFEDKGVVLRNGYGQFHINVDAEKNEHLIRVMDVTGDRGEEIVIGPDADGSFYVLEYTEAGFIDHGAWHTGNVGVQVRPEAIRAMDLNGDKLDDLLITSDSNGDWHALISTGSSFVYDGKWATGAYWKYKNEPHQSIRSSDVNGDGLLDILLGPYSGSGAWSYLENTGKELIDRGVVYNGYRSTHVALSDTNADGRQGYIRLGRVLNVIEPSGGKADLLKEVRNGIGGTTQISYVPSASFPNARLPFPIPVVSQIVRNDGNGNISTTNYEYSGGYYHHMQKDFRGFSYIKETGPAGGNGERKVVETWYHQGAGTTPAADEPSVVDGYTKSKPYLSKVLDGNGTLYSQTQTIYAPAQSSTLPYYFTPPQEVEVTRCDITGTCDVRSKTIMGFDAYGNLTRKEEWGDPDDPIDDRTTVNEYSVNLEDWIVGLAFRETVYQGIGTTNQVARTTYDYDSGHGNCSSSNENQTPTKGHVTRATRWLKNGTDPVEIFGYDSFGNQICSKDPGGNVSTISYDSTSTYPSIVTNAKGHQLTNRYYGVDGEAVDHGVYGQLKSMTDPNSAQKSYQYDLFGRKFRESLSDGSWATWSYNNFGTVGAQHAKLNNSLGLWYELYFDGQGRVIKTRQPGPGEQAGTDIIVNSKIYDLRGLLKQESLPYFEGSTVFYKNSTFDPLGRTLQTVFPDGRVEKACYGFDGSQITIDANQHKKRHQFDAYGRLVRVDEYTGEFSSCSPDIGASYATTRYRYDSLDSLTQVENATGNLTQISYDSLGRKVEMNDPDMGRWGYGYDTRGNLTYQRDAKGQILLFQYDSLNRLERKSYATGSLSALSNLESTDINHQFGYLNGTDLYLPTMLGKASDVAVDSDVVFTYDDTSRNHSIGRISRMVDSSGVTDYYYFDPLARDSRVDRTIDGQVYSIRTQVDAMQRTQAITYPGESQALVYLYDAAGNLSQAGSYATFSNYTAMGSAQTITYQNGVVAQNTFTAENGRLFTSQVGTTSSSYLSRQYAYFASGNIQSITDLLDSNKTQSFGYDELDRLKSANSVIYGALTYNYDQLGNLTHKEGIDYFTDTTAKPHQLVSSSNGRWYDHDANGNMLSDGVRSFEYDAENRPVAISYDGSMTTFVYDGHGNRVKKSGPHGDTTYIDKLYEINGASTAKYIFAGSKRVAMVNQTDTFYYHQDHLGGTSIVTDGNGNKVEQVFYKPFGEVIEDSGSVSLNHKYTGQELDAETDLYFYNARYYNPRIGRFVSPDSLVPHFYESQSFNRYGYVNNNPLNFIDPTGHYEVSVDTDGNISHGPGAQTSQSISIGGTGKDQNVSAGGEDNADAKSMSEHLSDMVGGLKGLFDGVLGSKGKRGKKGKGVQSNSNGNLMGAGEAASTIQNSLNIIGGLSQFAAGVAATSTFGGAILGIPLMVTGAINVIDGLTGLNSPTGKGFNISQAAIETGLTALDVANPHAMSKKYNAVINLSLDLVSLNLIQVSKKAPHMLFSRLRSDMTAAKYNMTAFGLGTQAATTISTSVGAFNE